MLIYFQAQFFFGRIILKHIENKKGSRAMVLKLFYVADPFYFLEIMADPHPCMKQKNLKKAWQKMY